MKHAFRLALAALAFSASTAAFAQSGTYRALGTEPFWSVTIGNGRMVYDDAEQRRVSVATPRPIIPRLSGRIYRTGRLIVMIRPGPCSDGMSDRTYQDSVRVRVDGRQLDGCGGSFTERSRLANTHWRISAINGRAVPASGPYRLDFTEDRLSGQAGCNRFGAGYRLEGDRLTVTPAVSTRMACPGPRMTHEAAVLRLLGAPLLVTQANEHSMTLVGRGGSIRLELVPGERPRSR